MMELGRSTGQIDDVRIYNRALSAAEILNLYRAGSAKVNVSNTAATANGGGNLANGLVGGWWTFDGKNMINNVADSSGNGNNGDMIGFTSTSSAVVPGKLGQALKFNGVNQYVFNGFGYDSFFIYI